MIKRPETTSDDQEESNRVTKSTRVVLNRGRGIFLTKESANAAKPQGKVHANEETTRRYDKRSVILAHSRKTSLGLVGRCDLEILYML